MNRIALASFSTLAILIWASRALPSPAAGGCAAVQNKIVDVRDFGASGDGSTDDTRAVQSAADCAVALFAPDGAGRGGVSLYFPKGSYRVTQQIRVAATVGPRFGGGIVIAGDGANASKLIAASNAGIFAVTMTKPGPGQRVELQVRDIGMVAGVANAGTALDVESSLPNAESRGRGSPLIDLRIRHLNITTAKASHANFNYGLRATGTLSPLLDDAHMSGAGASACYAFYFSYAPGVDHSSCQGAQLGVDVMYAAEADMITNSQFSDVGTAVRIRVVPGQAPGPSNGLALITGNDISAQNRGIDLTTKTFAFIVGNDFHVPANSMFVGVSLTDETQTYVSDNIFTGSGSAGTGVVLTTDPTMGRKPTNETTISRNKFEGVATAVSIGSGVLNTVLDSNSTSARGAVQDQGIGTVVLSVDGDLAPSQAPDRPRTH